MSKSIRHAVTKVRRTASSARGGHREIAFGISKGRFGGGSRGVKSNIKGM